jgi:acetolactate synthase I/II/III large subunit
LLDTAAPCDYLQLTGGSIGGGMPIATGAAVACPDRRVISLQGDGSAMYTLQALWTQAREKLDVTTVIYANRSYNVLHEELEKVGANAGAKASSMFDLRNPSLRWVDLARGMGVEAARVDTCRSFSAAFQATNSKGPFLIEAVV